MRSAAAEHAERHDCAGELHARNEVSILGARSVQISGSVFDDGRSVLVDFGVDIAVAL